MERLHPLHADRHLSHKQTKSALEAKRKL